MARRKRGFFNSLISFVIFALAFFGAWTLYNKHNKKIDDIVEVGFDKAKKVISEVSNNVKVANYDKANNLLGNNKKTILNKQPEQLNEEQAKQLRNYKEKNDILNKEKEQAELELSRAQSAGDASREYEAQKKLRRIEDDKKRLDSGNKIIFGGLTRRDKTLPQSTTGTTGITGDIRNISNIILEDLRAQEKEIIRKKDRETDSNKIREYNQKLVEIDRQRRKIAVAPPEMPSEGQVLSDDRNAGTTGITGATTEIETTSDKKQEQQPSAPSGPSGLQMAIEAINKAYMVYNVKDLAEEVDVPMSINSQWNCFFNPTEKVLKSCRAKGYCEGAGVYSQHTNKNVAIRIGMDKCVKEYGSCKLDYCEKSGR